VDDIAKTIDQVLGDAELRARLTAAGPPRAAEFSWERAADQTVASYEKVLAGRSA
jgi:glycosyltransferase involved in cell wall biosynthesis